MGNISVVCHLAMMLYVIWRVEVVLCCTILCYEMPPMVDHGAPPHALRHYDCYMAMPSAIWCYLVLLVLGKFDLVQSQAIFAGLETRQSSP